MKKAAILCIAAFYLLLTTGMFVCIIHCAGKSFFQPKMAMQVMNHNAHTGKKHAHCAKDKDCDCCNKHGNYVIKENIKPAGADFQAPPFAVILQQFNEIPVSASQQALPELVLRYGKAPPGLSGKAISIQFHSLQI